MAVNAIAEGEGVGKGMVAADAKAILPSLQLLDYDAAKPGKLLNALAEWCIRYSPYVALDEPDGLLMDATGCTHLWGGEREYAQDIVSRMKDFGYTVRVCIADTFGTAWAMSRYGEDSIVEEGKNAGAIAPLPAQCLRIDVTVVDKLKRLGLLRVESFLRMPRTALRRRFGQELLSRLDQALGAELEMPEPVRPVTPYQERLFSLEPICTAAGIGIALNKVLEGLCERLDRESKGLRKCVFSCHRIDGNIQRIDVGTTRPSRNPKHIFRLFENRIATIAPGLGIELFVAEATVVEEFIHAQDALWNVSHADDTAVTELLDRLGARVGAASIRRYLPAEHYWPERAVREASIAEKPVSDWRRGAPRPVHLLAVPEKIEVSVPMPDYPPLLFRYKGVLHPVKKADGPERIEQEWWIQQGVFRDYYCVEDDKGARYWLFRAGNYSDGSPEWFLHGFFG